MFNNLIKLSNGRTTSKILATLLVITLTFANFAMLGTFMLESIAIESSLGEQNTNTNSEHVKFNVYLDSNDINVREVNRDINSEDLELYVSVSVTGNGELEKGSIDFSNSNFKSKENEKIFTRDIETISSQKGITIRVPIVSRKDSSFNLSLLNMISKIKLTGEYVDENGNVEPIESEKEVKINWTTQGITKEQIKISKEIITNKISEINGIKRRVVQLLVKTNVEDNKVPVKSTKIEIPNPIANVVPEDVKVATYSTAATNGGSSIEFNNNQGSKWNYNEEENKTYIELTNITDGNVSWQKNATDELIVTYLYDENVNIESISSDVKVSVVVYGDENTVIEQTNNLPIEVVEGIGNIVDIKSSITKDIYKGYMYIGEETPYKTQYDVYVSYATANEIYVVDSGDTADSENLSTYYKSTLINKAQAINVLGNNGTIKIYNGENLQAPITEIILSQENSEDYITFNYSENVNNIVIVTSNPVKAGKIEIINEKAIKVNTLEKIEEATKLDVETNLYVKDSEGKEIEKSTKQGIANLLEPTTSVDLSASKTSISNQVEEELTLTAILNTNNNSNKLFSNPTINIELPKEITDANLLQNVSLLYEDELTIKSSDIKTNENGNKVVIIELEGNQTKYHTSANLLINLKVKANPFMANKEVEIKTTCINTEETVNDVDKINIISKNGLITKNTMQLGEETTQLINQDEVTIENIPTEEQAVLQSKVINNYNETINNVEIIGEIATNLQSEITLNNENAKIYYSEDLNNWVETAQDYTKIKAFKIVIAEMLQAEELEINCTVNSCKDMQESKPLCKLNINHNVENQALTKTIKFDLTPTNELDDDLGSAQTENVELKISKKSTLKELTEGQVVTYVLEAKNIGETDLNNLVLEYVVPEGAVYTELMDAQGSEITFVDDAEIKTKTFQIEKLEPQKTIKAEVSIKINKGTTQIINQVYLKDSNSQALAQIVSEPQEVKQAKVELYLSRELNISYDVTEGDIIKYVAIVKNVSGQKLENILLQCVIPQNTTYVENSEQNRNWEYNKETNVISYNIEELEAKQILEDGTEKEGFITVAFEVKVNNFNYEVTQSQIDNIITATLEEQQYESNVLSSNVIMSRFQINQTSPTSNQIEKGGAIKYVVTVKNIGTTSSIINVTDEIPSQIDILSVKVYSDEDEEGEFSEKEIPEDNKLNLSINIQEQETVTIEIEGIAQYITQEEEQIKNVAKIELGNNQTLLSEEITNTIINTDYEEEDDFEVEGDLEQDPAVDEEDPSEEDPSEEDPSEEDPDNPQDKDGTYSISGLAWLDENKNGIRDNNEQILPGIQVILLDEQSNIVTNSEGTELSTITGITGTYKFSNLPKGEYLVVFKYDTIKYSVTKYKTEDAEEQLNSDVISKEKDLNGSAQLVAVTDTIKIEDSNITNIDLGLVENPVFDLSLEKYVTKVIVTNDEESTSYEFNQETLAKVEIAAKKLSKSSILVQYEIKVTNNGDIAGYANDVIDYLPKELAFNSEMNPEWYSDSKGALHNISLSETAIDSGKSKTVKLVLTKLLNENSTGTIENTAEIGKSTNLQNIVDIDSTASNKLQGEDDINSASLIISIKTGGPALYIGIVIISLAVLGMGIYLIDKKVLKGGKI